MLTANNLTISIANKTICHNLQVEINAGETWGILGPNGSGKTTLLHTLARLQPALTGEIYLDKKIMSSLSTRNIAQELGILFQNSPRSFSQSVFEYCLAGRHPHLSAFCWENDDDNQIAKQALIDMELQHQLQQKIHTLSGGEYQRLAIATVLTQTPKIYLLDEPTNHLDVYYQIKVLNHFKQLAEKNTVAIVMALHDANIAQHYCSHILMLFEDGETLYGTPDNILTTENLRRLYQHPLHAVLQDNQRYWLPEFSVTQLSRENCSS